MLHQQSCVASPTYLKTSEKNSSWIMVKISCSKLLPSLPWGFWIPPLQKSPPKASHLAAFRLSSLKPLERCFKKLLNVLIVSFLVHIGTIINVSKVKNHHKILHHSKEMPNFFTKSSVPKQYETSVPRKKGVFVLKSIWGFWHPRGSRPASAHKGFRGRRVCSENRRPVSPKTARPKNGRAMPWTPTTRQTTFLEHHFSWTFL